MDAWELFMLLEKCCITLLASCAFLRFHEKRHLVACEKPALGLLLVSITVRNWYGVSAPSRGAGR